MSSKRLQDILQKCLQDIFKTSLRRFQDIFNMSPRRLAKMYSRHPQDAFKTF